MQTVLNDTVLLCPMVVSHLHCLSGRWLSTVESTEVFMEWSFVGLFGLKLNLFSFDLNRVDRFCGRTGCRRFRSV